MKYENKKSFREDNLDENSLYENAHLMKFFREDMGEDDRHLHKWFRDRDSECVDEERLIDPHL